MERINKHQMILDDDDPDYKCLFEKALRNCHPRPTNKGLHSGASLLEWLETSARSSLFFLDVKMAGSSGLDVLKVLKGVDRYKTTPVIMLLVSEDRPDIVAAYDYGANAYMTKATLVANLVPNMQRFSRHWFDVARTPDARWTKPDGYTPYD